MNTLDPYYWKRKRYLSSCRRSRSKRKRELKKGLNLENQYLELQTTVAELQMVVAELRSYQSAVVEHPPEIRYAKYQELVSVD